MPKSISFWEHPIDKIEEALSIRKQIAALQAKLTAMFGSEEEAPKVKRGPKTGKRTMSAEARERIAAAQRARWAKIEREAKPKMLNPGLPTGPPPGGGKRRKAKPRRVKA